MRTYIFTYKIYCKTPSSFPSSIHHLSQPAAPKTRTQKHYTQHARMHACRSYTSCN